VIGFYLHHHGSGHRTRGTTLARLVRAPVTGLGSGGAPRGWPSDWVELARDDEPRVSRTAAADVTAGGVLHWVPRHHPGLLDRHATLVAWLASVRPSLMVVDVSVEVALVARLCGIPVVVAAMAGDRTDRPHRLAYDLADHLLAPWPLPAHPARWPRRWSDKAWHVGGLSRFHERTLPPPSDAAGRRVLVLWGEGGSEVTERDVAGAREATPGWQWVQRGGEHPAAPDLWAELAGADVVVTHAGQNAVADVAHARRPAVVVAQSRPHDEQLATARAVDRMGLAEGLDRWPEPGRWADLLRRAQERGGMGWRAWDGVGPPGAARLLDAAADETDDAAAEEMGGESVEEMGGETDEAAGPGDGQREMSTPRRVGR